MPRPLKYTPAEDAWLRAHYTTATRAEVLAAVPGRTWPCLQNHASKLRATGRPLGLPVADRITWHPANLRLLRALYPTGGAAAVAAATGLSAHSVRAQASRLQLRCLVQQLPPVKAPCATTPNVNASMSRTLPAGCKETGLAQAIARHKTLKYGQPEHTAFLRDGLAGWQQWKAAQ